MLSNRGWVIETAVHAVFVYNICIWESQEFALSYVSYNTIPLSYLNPHSQHFQVLQSENSYMHSRVPNAAGLPGDIMAHFQLSFDSVLSLKMNWAEDHLEEWFDEDEGKVRLTLKSHAFSSRKQRRHIDRQFSDHCPWYLWSSSLILPSTYCLCHQNGTNSLDSEM